MFSGDRELDAVRSGTGASEWKVEPAEGPKPLNLPNPGTFRGNYFQCGYPKKAFDKVNWYVRNRLHLQFHRKSQHDRMETRNMAEWNFKI